MTTLTEQAAEYAAENVPAIAPLQVKLRKLLKSNAVFAPGAEAEALRRAERQPAEA